MHRPASPEDVRRKAPFRTRLAYDELFARQCALRLRRAHRRKEPGRAMIGDGRLRTKLLASLPFAPTGAQTRSVKEIYADMAEPAPMLRLLQGDVGSGKTLVAALAMARAAEAGLQSAMMAPTDLLARQHGADARAAAGGGWHHDGGADRARQRQGAQGDPGAHGVAASSHVVDRHACSVPGRRRVPRSRPHRHRRAASLRRLRPHAHGGQGLRAARAGDERDADPAHAGALHPWRHGSLRARREAAGPPADQDRDDADVADERSDRSDRATRPNAASAPIGCAR